MRLKQVQREIIDTLRDGGADRVFLEEELGIDQPTAKRSLAQLRHHGLVVYDRFGDERFPLWHLTGEGESQ